MQITTSNLSFFFSQMNNQFWTAYTTSPIWHDKVAQVIPSSTDQNVYGWVGQLDKVREWIGPRVEHNPAPQTYILANKLFELTESVDRIKLENDQYGIYKPMVEFMAMNIKKWPDQQLRDLLNNIGAQTGSLQNGLDGNPHWYASHPIDLYDASKGTYCNDFGTAGVVVNGVTVGGAFSPTAYTTLRQEMMSRRGENNESLGINPNLVLNPPQLETAVKTILHADFFAPQTYLPSSVGTSVGPMQNMLVGTAEMLTSHELFGYPTTWYLLDTTKPIKPFVFQLRAAPNFVYRINPQDPVVFNEHKYIYGSEMQGAVGWSHAWLSSRSGV